MRSSLNRLRRLPMKADSLRKSSSRTKSSTPTRSRSCSPRSMSPSSFWSCLRTFDLVPGFLKTPPVSTVSTLQISERMSYPLTSFVRGTYVTIRNELLCLLFMQNSIFINLLELVRISQDFSVLRYAIIKQ